MADIPEYPYGYLLVDGGLDRLENRVPNMGRDELINARLHCVAARETFEFRGLDNNNKNYNNWIQCNQIIAMINNLMQ